MPRDDGSINLLYFRPYLLQFLQAALEHTPIDSDVGPIEITEVPSLALRRRGSQLPTRLEGELVFDGMKFRFTISRKNISNGQGIRKPRASIPSGDYFGGLDEDNDSGEWILEAREADSQKNTPKEEP